MKKDKASAPQSKPSPTAKDRNNHEDELAFLKGKLVDLHTRLINQLDVCKQQEKQIIQLTQQNNELRQAVPGSSRGHEELFEEFEALRDRLKATEGERNRYKQQLQFLAQKYTELEDVHSSAKKSKPDNENQQLKKKLASVEGQLSKLKQQLAAAQADRSSNHQRLVQLDRGLKQEKEVNRTLTETNKELQAQLFNMVIKSESLEEENAELKSNKSQSSKDTNKEKEMERMRRQLKQLQDQIRENERYTLNLRAHQQHERSQYVDRPVVDRSPARRPTTPRRTYQQTQDLIRRLQQAEQMTRNRNTKSVSRLHNQNKHRPEDGILNRQLTFEHNESQEHDKKLLRY